MDLNATLLGEMLTFALLVWVTMRYIWPLLDKALQERQEKIAAGLAAAEQGQRNLAVAKTHAAQTLREAKSEATIIVQHANEQASSIVHTGRAQAQQEREQILLQAKSDITHEIDEAKHALGQHTSDLVMLALTKILKQRVDTTLQAKFVDELITHIAHDQQINTKH